jgi:putative ABC transport system substrate-binding protein
MVNASDPVEAGLVASLARPGGNVTGLSQQLTREIRAKQLQLLKETLPKMSRVAVLHSVATTVGLREYEAAGQTLEVRVQVVEIRNRDTLEHTFAAMARERIDALLVPADPFLYSARLTEQFRRAAIYVDKILRGASPATLPVESPSQYELVINLKAAKALGLTIPPSLLQRADQVIE